MRFEAMRAMVDAVAGVSLSLRYGETLGLVGESRYGKSTFGRATARLINPPDGAVRLVGIDLTQLLAPRLRSRWRDSQLVFRDPVTSHDPRWTVGSLRIRSGRPSRV